MEKAGASSRTPNETLIYSTSTVRPTAKKWSQRRVTGPVNAGDGPGVEGELRAVQADFGFQFLLHKMIRFEIEHPNFLRRDHGQVHHALDDHEFIPAAPRQIGRRVLR